MEYAHPLYTPESVAAQRAPARGRHDAARVRRRLPRLGLPRGRRAFRAGRRRAARPGVGRTLLRLPDAGAATTTTIRHTRRRPSAAVQAPLARLARRPRRPARPRPPSAGSRPATTSARPTPRSAPTSTAFLAEHGIDLDRRPRPDGRARRAPSATASTRSASSGASTPRARRRARWSRCTTPTATGTPTSSIPTSRAGRAPTRQMYVSPFHGVDGSYDLAVPVPGARPAGLVTLHTDDGAARLQRDADRTSQRRPRHVARPRRQSAGRP